MIFTESKLKGAFIIELEPRADHRGFFARSFCQKEFAAHGIKADVAQANISFNHKKGTVRGLHFQYPPAGETKLMRCSRGAFLDVIVDLRPESPTFLEHIAVELSADNHRALFVPERFAHGFMTLEDKTEASYHVGEFYTPSKEGGLMYNDPDLAIVWPMDVQVISEKDSQWRPLKSVLNEIRSGMALEAVA